MKSLRLRLEGTRKHQSTSSIYSVRVSTIEKFLFVFQDCLGGHPKFSSKYGYANAPNLSEAEKRQKSRKLLQERLGRGKGVRFDPKIKPKIGDYTERDYFRLFFEKDHASTQTSFGDEKRKRFRSKGSCTQGMVKKSTN